MTGYVQVYTGNGKGKTTAAIGLAVRAAGAGLRVFIGQFLKCGRYSELKMLKLYEKQITVRQYGREGFITGPPEQEDIDLAQKGLAEVNSVIMSGEYDVVILDEVNVATSFKLFPVDELVHIIEHKPERVELILTGRDADDTVIEKADLVTEMIEVKHYYSKGVSHRTGIEE